MAKPIEKLNDKKLESRVIDPLYAENDRLQISWDQNEEINLEISSAQQGFSDR